MLYINKLTSIRHLLPFNIKCYFFAFESNFSIYYPILINVYLWNFGFLAGLCLIIQIISKVFIGICYIYYIGLTFDSLKYSIINISSELFFCMLVFTIFTLLLNQRCFWIFTVITAIFANIPITNKKLKNIKYESNYKFFNFNFNYKYFLFFFIFYIWLHAYPSFTILIISLLIPVLHLIPSFKKYCIYKYILVFLLFFYIPIAFYFYVKWLVLGAFEMHKIVGDFLIIKENCVRVDINLDSLEYWHLTFLDVPEIRLPIFEISIRPWFILTFVHEVYIMIVLFSYTFNLNNIYILVYV